MRATENTISTTGSDMTRFALVVLAVSILGCASTQPTRSRSDVADLVVERGGVDKEIADDFEHEVRERVDSLLAKPLNDHSAAAVALLNNPQFRATTESLGLAQADLVEAGLLDNPAVGGHLVISTRGNGLGGGLSLSQSILSAFLIPAKRRLAKAEVKHAVMLTGHAALVLLRDTKVAMAQVRGATNGLNVQRSVVQAAEVADDLARRQLEAGNITVLRREEQASDLDHARLELLEHEVELVRAREQLNRVLGLWGEDTSWTLDASVETPPAALDRVALERRAVEQRLDVSAARVEVEVVQRALELRRRGVVSAVDVGVEAGNEVGNDEGHEWVVGPALSIELPLFNPGHADFARLRAMQRQAHLNLETIAIATRSTVRERVEQLRAAQRTVAYLQDTVIPRRQGMTARALEQYNGMLIGAYDLFEVKEGEFEAHMHLAHAQRDEAVARADLELALGGEL